MSGNFSSIRWLWIIVGAFVGAVVFMALTMVSNVGYGVVIGFQMRGAPPSDILVDAISSMPYALLSFVWAFLGGLIGGRLGARRSVGAAQLAGLLIGIITATVITFARLTPGGPGRMLRDWRRRLERFIIERRLARLRRKRSFAVVDGEGEDRRWGGDRWIN